MFQLIAMFATWARAADLRAGMVAAALGTIGLGTTGQSDALQNTTRPGNPFSLALLVALLGCAVASGVFVVRVLSAEPHLHRTSFLPVDGHQLAVSRHAGQGDLYDDLCEQAWILARIAQRKFRMLRRAVLLAACAALAFLGWTVLAAVQPR